MRRILCSCLDWGKCITVLAFCSPAFRCDLEMNSKSQGHVPCWSTESREAGWEQGYQPQSSKQVASTLPWEWSACSTLGQPVAPVSLSTPTSTAGFAQSCDHHNVSILYFESVGQRTYSYLKTAVQNEHLLHTRYNFTGINTLLTGPQTLCPFPLCPLRSSLTTQ